MFGFGYKEEYDQNLMVLGGTDPQCPNVAGGGIFSISCPTNVGMYFITPWNPSIRLDSTNAFYFGDEVYSFKICYNIDTTPVSCFATEGACAEFPITGGVASKAKLLYDVSYYLDNKNKKVNVVAYPPKTYWGFGGYSGERMDICAMSDDNYESGPWYYLMSDIQTPIKIGISAKEPLVKEGWVFNWDINTIGSSSDIVTRENPDSLKDVFMRKEMGPNGIITLAEQQEGVSEKLFSLNCVENSVEDQATLGKYNRNEIFKILGIPVFDFKVMLIIVGLIGFFGFIRLLKH
jgi:hypothetical protein